MEASVISYFAAHRDSELWISDEHGAALDTGFDSMPWKKYPELIPQLECPPPYEALPTYGDALDDEPPAYVNTDLLALLDSSLRLWSSSKCAHSSAYASALVPDPSQTVLVDLSRVEGIRNHASKKAKQAAKKAQQAKWADSDNEGEGSKDGGDGDQNGDGGSGGGAGGDGGGDGDGWNDGGGWDDAPGKKNKKKNKKGKKDDDEEEEEEKEEDGAKAFASTSNFWDNLDDFNNGGDANPDDEWGLATAGKKGKKGKKGKADPAPPPPASADKLMDPTFDDINLDAPKIDLSFGGSDSKGNDYSFGNWGSGWGFSGLGSAGKSTADADKDTAMDSTNMWDMGAGKKDAKKKTTKKSTGFDFGFGNAADDLAGEDAVADVKKDDDPLAGFTTAIGKKDKKGKKTIGFAALDDIVPDAPMVVFAESEDGKDDDSFNPWGTSKKDKKSAKKGTSNKDLEPPPPPPPPPPAPAEAEDIWSLSTKTDKKKSKKDDKSTTTSAVVVVPEIEPVSPISNGDDGWDIWGSASKKDKKKKKVGKEESFKDDPIVVVPDAASSEGADDILSIGSFSTKKDKDKKKSTSNAFTAIDDLLATEQPNGTGMDDGWNWGTATKGDKKKSKKAIVDEPLPPPPPAVPEPPASESKDDDWMTSAIWGNSKKEKKTKKGKAGESDSVWDKKSIDGDVTASKDIAEEPKNDPFDWGSSWDIKKDKKKKDAKKIGVIDEPVTISILQEDSVPDTQVGGEDDPWSWGSTLKKEKKKTKKDISVPPPVPTPPNLGLTPGNSPPLDKERGLDNVDLLDLDEWSSSLNGKAKAKKDVKKGTTTAASVTSATSKDVKTDRKLSKQSSKDDDPIVAIIEEPAKPSPKEEKKSFWSSFGGATTVKSKSAKEIEKEAKEKEKKEAEEAEKARLEKEEAELAEAAKKDAKKKSSSSSSPAASTKLDSKTTSKKGKDDEAAAEAREEKPPSPDEKKTSKKSDAWSFWSASTATAAAVATATATNARSSEKEKRTSAIDAEKEKEKEQEKEAKKPAGRSDKEIANDKPANHKAALPEPPPAKNNKDAPLKSSASAASGKSSTAAAAATAEKDVKKDKDKEKDKDKKSLSPTSSSVADKAKTPDKKAAAPSPPPPPPPPDPVLKAAANKVEPKGTTVTRKPVGKSSSPINKKDAAEADFKPGKLSSAVPGGFPLDDNVDLIDDGFADMAPSKKSDKSIKKTSDKKGKDSKEREPVIVELPPDLSPPAADAKKKSSSDIKKKSSKSPEPTKLPTPPPEPDSKSSKKERPRVVRDEGSSSWGFWGTTSAKSQSDSDKKDSKSKPAAEVAPPAKKEKDSAPGLSRSKSERKPPVKDADKLSGSGSDELKKSDSRPSKPSASRGMSFSSIFGSAPPPARSASKRESVSGATSSSRRRSVDVGAALPTPSPEGEKKLPDKAAKTLGIDRRNSMPARSQSMREKPKKRDPFAIDEEDELVMVDPPSKDKDALKSSTSKRKSTKSRKDSIDEDAVLVERAPDKPVDKSSKPALKRSESSAKKSEGLMGLFGSMRKKERRPSVSEEDDPKRLRRESRRVERSQMPSDSKGNSTDASPGDTDPDPEAEARRAERRKRRAEREAKAKEQRETELAEQADREARQKSRDRAKVEARKAKAKEERSRQRQEEEDRRARRATKDAKGEGLAAQEEQDDSDRRRRRRERASLDVGDTRDPTRLRHTDRRRSLQPESKSYVYAEDDDYARRTDRRPRRSAGITKADLASKSYRRRSWVPDDFFDSRNGVYGDNRPSISRVGTDKTASWVHSVNIEPPLPPPVEGTVVEPEPELGPSSKSRREPRRSEYRRDRDRERAERRSDEEGGGRRRSEYYDDVIGPRAPLTARGLDAITGANRGPQKGAAGFLRKMGF